MAVPSSTDLMKPTLEAIYEAGGSALIGEITELVTKKLALSDETVNELHGGRGPQSKLEHHLGWARTYLKQHGLITNLARGVWVLTPRGRYEVAPEGARIRREFRQSSSQPDGDIEGPSEESEDWKGRLMAALLDMRPDAFERLCQLVLRESGFVEVKVTGRSGDGGIDGHGIIRMGGMISFPVLFQCKRYRGSVTPNHVRDFRGAMAGRSDRGLLITTGGFTRDAKQEAIRDGVPPIDLMDGNLLADKLKELQLGVKTEMVEQVTVDSEWFSTI